MEMRTKNLTRIAPTPSGYLHIGNLYSFVITWLIAKRAGAKILLRIDDLDSLRVRTEYIDDIFRTLEFAGLDYDLGPSGTGDFLARHSQRHRLDLYEEALQRLAENGSVFACRCSRKEILEAGTGGCAGNCADDRLPLNADDAAWRFHSGKSSASFMQPDGGTVTAEIPSAMRQTVLRKKDGHPSYQLANVVDDSFYGVDLIVRGKDLLPSTLVQIAISEALGDARFPKTAFYHHDLVTRGGEKLSKTQNAPSVRSAFTTRAELLTRIASMLGINRPVSSPEELLRLSDELNTPLPAAAPDMR